VSEDVFQEVEESLRQDKASALWKKYGGYAIGAVVAVILGVGAWEVYSWQRGQAIEADAAAYATAIRALEAGDLAAAQAGLSSLAEDDDGFAVLANHMLADVERQLSADEAAVGARLKAASEADDGPMGRIALLKLAYMQADSADLAALGTLVQPLVDAGGNESALARELLAAKKLAVGQTEAARADYQALSLDLDAPEGLKRRVQQVLGTLPAPAVAGAAETPAPVESAPAAPAQASAPNNP
jgi:hypothetical protein